MTVAYRAHAAKNGTVVAARLRPAHTHWTRLRGLLGTRALPPGEGLWLRPCRQVHMVGMRYPVDVVFLDEDHRVVHTVRALPPGAVSAKVRAAASVLELPIGSLDRAGLETGDRVDIEGGSETVASTPLDAAGAIAANVALAALYLFFASAHFEAARRTGNWTTTMPLVLQEAVLVVLFLTRRRSVASSTHPSHWLVAIVGVFLPLLMRPVDQLGSLSGLGRALQVVGVTAVAVTAVFLGRSIGVVPANRGIKTHGLYRAVRHPMYGAYLLSYVGYVLSYPTPRNVLIAVATVAALNFRALAEERLLTHDPAYEAYLRRIRWRFLPYLY